MDIVLNNINQILDEINMMIAVISRDNTLISANKALLEFADVKIEDIVGIAYWDLPWWQHSSDLQNKLLFAINDSYMGHSSRFNATHTDAKGDLHEIDFIIRPVMKDDEPEYFIAMGYNITDLVSAQKELTQRDRRLKAFFDYSIEGYFFLSLPDQVEKEAVTEDIVKMIIEQYRLEGSNPRLLEILGIDVLEVRTIFESVGIYDDLESLVYRVVHEGYVTLETQITVDAKIRHLNVVFAAIYGENSVFEGNFAIVRDMTSEVNNLENIKYLANKDYLTGINNRRSFFNLGETLFEKSKENGDPFTVVMLDIDHFKKVNDTYGHDAGDVVIKDIAKYIEKNIGENSVLGRYGGEEYVIVIQDEVDAAYKMFERIRTGIEDTVFTCDLQSVKVTISIGLVYVDYEMDTLESAISKSDRALYESKENGRNQSTIFVEEIHGAAAIDKVTGLFNEKSMRFKLEKALYDVKQAGESLWLLYFRIDVVKEMDFIDKDRHLKTMSLCMTRALRERDYIGRVGTNGFLVVLKEVSSRRIDDIFNRINSLLELGFSGMLDRTVVLKGCSFNAALSSDLDVIFKTLEKNADKIL